MRNGAKDKFWYEECEQTLIDIFGKDNVRHVAKLLAATSINSSLKSNLRLFEKAKYQIENRLPIVGYLPVMRTQIEYIRDGKPLSGRKINNFANAISGDKDAIVADIWIARAFKVNRTYKRLSGPHEGLVREGGVADNIYNKIENYLQHHAPKHKLQPRQMCAMIWGGIRTEQTGKQNTTRYCDILRMKFTNLFT